MPAASFAQQIAPDVIRNCINTGVFPSLVIAQAIEESGAGTSKLAQQFNNLFGHAASALWPGKKAQTKPGGKYWRVYDSVASCIKAHISILKKPGYILAGVLTAKTPVAQAAALQKGGYNQGPDRSEYAFKLAKIIKQYNLQQYDEQMFAIERNKNSDKLAYHEQPILTKALHTLI